MKKIFDKLLIRKPKWQIRYVDKTEIKFGKTVILAAKTIAQAKEKFNEVYKNVKIVSVMKLS